MSSKQPVKIINNQTYIFEIKLYNNSSEIVLNPMGILQLVIEDDFHFWPTLGYFIYESPYEALERDFDSNTPAKQSFFNFNGNGEDFIEILIKPIISKDTKISYPTLPDNIWELNLKGVIFDREDLPTVNNEKKLKKFYFCDKKYFEMKTKNIEWSTATSSLNLKSKTAAQNSDDDRSMLLAMLLFLFYLIMDLKNI